MAASLMTLTGQPKALRKSNPIQPLPRLCGSRRGHSLMIGPGKPSDTQSNFQSWTNFLTTRTILRGVMVGPDGYFRGSFCPVASTLMFVPPMSMTRTLRPLECFILFAMDSLPRTIAPSVHHSRRHSCNKLKAELPAIILFRQGTHTMRHTIVCLSCERVSDRASYALGRQTLTIRTESKEGRNLSDIAWFR